MQQRALLEHEEKLAKFIADGSYTSSATKTIKNVTKVLRTVEKFISDFGL
jgi:hypothetical protein